MGVDVNVRERILKPARDVFEALVNPAQMKHYFISESTGPMKAGVKVEWEFADVGAKVPVNVLSVDDEGRKIVFEWQACGEKTQVTVKVDADGADAAVVTLNEGKFQLDPVGVKRALGQNAGWTYTLCCLKAYLQFGVNLRLGLNKRLTEV